MDGNYDSSSPTDADGIHHGETLQQPMGGAPHAHTSHPHIPYHSNIGMYQPSPYLPRPEEQHQIYHDVSPMPMNIHGATYQQTQAMFPTPPAQSVQSTGTGSYWEQQSQHSEGNHSTAEELSEALGELKIDETGYAPYLKQQHRASSPERVPVQEDAEAKLPPLSTGAGSTVRIPPELLPSQEDALHYFDVYFADIHPYVPVIHRSHFYHQWHTNRSAISPLLLEAVFACAGRMSDDPAQGAQWLALASRHEDSFMDEPRLSTLQALLILLKARESAPKKGYYFRSWMTIKTLVSMAKDLELHEHYSVHSSSSVCEYDPVECLTRTRVWQTLHVVETMVGGPQGRFDMGVDPDTVEIGTQQYLPDPDEFEAQLSRQFAFFVQNARNIRLITSAYAKLRKQKDWGADPRFVGFNPAFTKWLEELPHDLQLSYPVDGSRPWLPSHFVGNMHTHYHLGVIMLHRPQLLTSKSFAADGAWKQHMALCYSSAKALCRIQEALVDTFGLNGLLYMQRGINFTIYSVLTCTMLHLVSITSPDPDFYTDAREYFTRHMRILEKCTSAWPLPEMQAQIDALRLAFSADISKPFDLKGTFPFGSPSEPLRPSPPPLDMHLHSSHGHHNSPHNAQSHIAYLNQPITPPVSAGHGDPRNSPDLQTLVMGNQAHGHAPVVMNQVTNVDGVAWNPTRIFDSWNTAFGTPPSALAPPSNNTLPQSSSPIHMPPPSAVQGMPTYQHPYSQQYPQATPVTSMPQTQQPILPNYGDVPSFVTPKDWQQSVASAFDPDSLKRRWDYEGHASQIVDGHLSKRVR